MMVLDVQLRNGIRQEVDVFVFLLFFPLSGGKLAKSTRPKMTM